MAKLRIFNAEDAPFHITSEVSAALTSAMTAMAMICWSREETRSPMN